MRGRIDYESKAGDSMPREKGNSYQYRVVKHKSFFFACSWAHYETVLPGTFRLIPPKARAEELRKDYQQMRAMIFDQAPEWENIIGGLTELEARINSA